MELSPGKTRWFVVIYAGFTRIYGHLPIGKGGEIIKTRPPSRSTVTTKPAIQIDTGQIASVDQQLKRAAARQDFFVSPLGHLCNGIGSSLRSDHAMLYACHHMSTLKKNTAAGEVHMQSHSHPQLAVELQKFSHKNMAL